MVATKSPVITRWKLRGLYFVCRKMSAGANGDLVRGVNCSGLLGLERPVEPPGVIAGIRGGIKQDISRGGVSEDRQPAYQVCAGLDHQRARLEHIVHPYLETAVGQDPGVHHRWPGGGIFHGRKIITTSAATGSPPHDHVPAVVHGDSGGSVIAVPRPVVAVRPERQARARILDHHISW